jgi:hypothetical protein
MSLAMDSNAAATTKPLMKKLRGVQLLHSGYQQELDATAMYSQCGPSKNGPKTPSKNKNKNKKMMMMIWTGKFLKNSSHRL